uniref:DUF5688 family protein n=1 Tax=Enterocloster clostridioformis TaxID=1531 RepID=UPI001C3C3007|nr:DUF5688 family protein [Enterocloster clostridioformis]
MAEEKSIQLWELANTDPERFMKVISDYRQMEGRLRCRLVSHETNFNFFTAGPYQKHPMGEAALFFHAGQNGDTRIEYHVSFEMVQKWGRSEAEILETALKNTEKHAKSTFRDLDTVLAEQMGIQLPESYKPQTPMYLLSNEERAYGATAVMYPGMLQKIREQVEMDYYLLPTSVHELTILPQYPFLDPAKIRETVRRDNRESISPADVLSDHLFEYRSETGKLERCHLTEKEKNREEGVR